MNEKANPPKKKVKSKKLPLQAIFIAGTLVVAAVGVALGGLAVYTDYSHQVLPWQGKKPASNQLLLIADNTGSIHALQMQLDQINAAMVHANSPSTNTAKAHPQTVLSHPAKLGSAKLYFELAKAELVSLGNVKSALSFINEAQLSLTKNGHSDLAAKVESEIAIAKKMAPTSQSSIENQLSAIEQQLTKLSFRLPIDLSVKQPAHADDKKQPLYQKALNESWDRIKSLLIIRDNQSVNSLQLTDAARASTLAIIGFEINRAKTAALSGNWRLYDQALMQISAKSKSAFMHNNAYIQFMKQVKQAASVTELVMRDKFLSVIDSALERIGGKG